MNLNLLQDKLIKQCTGNKHYTPEYTCMHACIHTYIHTYIHTCIHTYIHTYKHTYIYIYIYGSGKMCIDKYIFAFKYEPLKLWMQRPHTPFQGSVTWLDASLHSYDITIIAWQHAHSDYLWISVLSENPVTHNPFLMWETHNGRQINWLHSQITLYLNADKCRL